MEMMVKKSLDPDKTINSDLDATRYDELARSMGAHGEFVSDPDDLAPALARCFESGRCSVIHVEVDRAKHLWAPALRHFKTMHQEPAGK
jgi:acetolactate synthase-1/2/3 large subunit